MDLNLLDAFTQCKDRMDMLKEAVAKGNCTSFDEYRFACGQIRGLEAACAILKDLNDRMENHDDE